MTFSCHVSLGSFWLWQFLRLCYWWPWQFWGEQIRSFIECSSNGICLVLFSWVDWCYGFLRGSTPRSRAIFMTFLTIAHTVSMAYHCCCWPWSPDWVVPVRFLHCNWKVTLPPIHYSTLWKEYSSHLWGGERCSISFRGDGFWPGNLHDFLLKTCFDKNVEK